MTTSSATISSMGVGSGLDANAIVTKLVALERQPITNLQTQADKLQTKISAYGQIQSAVSTFRDAAQKLANPDVWASTIATSADSSAVSFTTSSGAATGSYSMKVTSLAASQSVVTKTALASSTATLGSGSLSIELGSWSEAGAFSAKAGSSATSITIAATDTLEGIRDKINSAGAGVKASIINDSSGARLVMSSSSTGAAYGFRIMRACPLWHTTHRRVRLAPSQPKAPLTPKPASMVWMSRPAPTSLPMCSRASASRWARSPAARLT